jgi:hypothetical protein
MPFDKSRAARRQNEEPGSPGKVHGDVGWIWQMIAPTSLPVRASNTVMRSAGTNEHAGQVNGSSRLQTRDHRERTSSKRIAEAWLVTE